MQKSMLWKLATVVGLCLLSMIPLAMVRGVIAEREALRNGVIRDFENRTVGPQVLKGPVLVVPYRRTVVETREERAGNGAAAIEVKRSKTVSGQLFILPESLEIDGDADVRERSRGIYRVRAFETRWKLRGRFELPARFGTGAEHEQYVWGRPELAFGIADPRGILPGIALTVNGRAEVPQAGTSAPGLGRGIHVMVDASKALAGSAQALEFELGMNLSGLSRIGFLPSGRTSTVRLASPWPHPGFFGPLLAQHQIDAHGFTAVWNASDLGSNVRHDYAACFEGKGCEAFEAGTFGVSLIDPVDLYLQLERSAKYGLLFVGLTFIAFFLFDVLRRCPIHPVQYGLVGGALVIFYLLLTSLSEHMDFAWAYLIASGACVALIGYYVAHVLGSARRGGAVGAMLAVLYGVLFVILRSEDNALLMGSILLFALVAGVMIGTRKVDWYRLGGPAPGGSPA
jgi:inner membrane protein